MALSAARTVHTAGAAPATANPRRVDRVTLLALRLAVQARENLAAALAEAPRDRDFPALLAEIRASGLFSVPELAELAGLSRSRTYELLAEAER